MKKIWLISSSEFYQNFRSRGYLLATFGAPLIALVFIIIFGTQKGIYSRSSPLLNLGLLDNTNVLITKDLFDKDKQLDSQIKGSDSIFYWMVNLSRKWQMVDSRVDAKAKLFSNDLDGVFEINKSDADPQLFDFTMIVKKDKIHLLPAMKIDKNWLFQRWLKRSLPPPQYLAFQNFDLPKIQWFDENGHIRQMDYRQAVANENEKSSWVHIGVFLVAIMLLSGYLSSGLTDEREQKTLEYLFTLLTPFELLVGKLFGTMISGILQVVTWGITFIFPALFFFWSMKHAFINWLVPFLFFFFGYMFYGGVLLSLSSSASTGRESRQTAASWLFFNAIPLAFYPYVIANPQDWFVHLLSLIPISAPMTMMIRIGIDQAPNWEIALSLFILIGTTILVLKLSAERVMKNMMRKV